MSGINELKRKAKFSIDELYADSSVKEAPQKIKKEGKPTPTSVIEKSNAQVMSETSLQSVHQTNGHSDIQTDENPETVKSNVHGSQMPSTNPQIFTPKQTPQKTPTFKMTFTLTEEAYKAFNDLYAKRMLQGLKTEKSEMICEAIQWLITMEEKKPS